MDYCSLKQRAHSAADSFAHLSTAQLYALLAPVTAPPAARAARFVNWGRTFACTPLAVFEPESELQCQLVLELARREGRRVRFAGIGHSPSDLACTKEYMLRTTRLNKVLEVGHLSPGSMTQP